MRAGGGNTEGEDAECDRYTGRYFVPACSRVLDAGREI